MTLRSARLFFFSVLPVALTLAQPRPARAQAPHVQTGVVVDAQGAPVLRARVQLVDSGRRTLAQGLTDDRGRFRLESPRAECRVEVSLAGFEPATTACTAAAAQLVLAPAPVREAVVVSATRDAAPLSQVGSSVTVFTAADIDRRGAVLVADLLRATPGVTVVQSGAPGTQTSIFVRGGESHYNKVLLDGIPVNEPGGTFNFGNLTTEHLDRIEVVRGAESALFGSDAMSSVIQLFTKRAGPERLAGTFTAEAGAHDSLRAGVSMSGRSRLGDAAFGLTRFHTDNHVPNNAFRNTTATWNATAPLGGRATLRAVGRVERGRVGTPGATAFGRPDMDAFFDRSDVTAGIAFEHSVASVRQRLSYGFARSGQTSTNLIEDAPFVPAFADRQGLFEFSDFLYDNRNVLRRHQLSHQIDWRPAARRIGAHFLTSAVDVDLERARLNNRLTGLVIDASRNNVGWTLQHQLVATRTTVTSGVRVERNETFGTVVVPRLALVHQLRSGGAAVGETLLKLSAGTGVKEPTILQSFSPSPSFLGNPDLEPERSRAVSAAVEQRLADGRAKVDVVWFDHRYRNQISTRTVSFTPFRSQYFNIGRTSAKGLEVTVTVAPTAHVRARAGYTLLVSRIVESTAPANPVFATGAWAFRRPRHAGVAELFWTRGRFDAGLTGLVVGRRTDSDFVAFDPPISSAPAYTVWAVSTRYRATARVDVTLRIDNVTDTDYMEPLGFPAWGRAAHAAVRVRF